MLGDDKRRTLETLLTQLYHEKRERRQVELATVAFFTTLLTGAGLALILSKDGQTCIAERGIYARWATALVFVAVASISTWRIQHSAWAYSLNDALYRNVSTALKLCESNAYGLEAGVMCAGETRPAWELPAPAWGGWCSAVAYVWVVTLPLCLYLVWAPKDAVVTISHNTGAIAFIVVTGLAVLVWQACWIRRLRNLWKEWENAARSTTSEHNVSS